MKRILLPALFACLPLDLSAHPHIFIDTRLDLTVDADQRLRHVEVTWVYDEFYSLLLLQDMELDNDLDGVLTADELSQLKGFDLNWDASYLGDLYIEAGGVAQRLGAPEHIETSVVDGQIVTRHRRVVEVPAQGLVVRAYDPTFYTAYALNRQVTITGDCTAQITEADLNGAYAALEEILFNMPQAQTDEAFPEVGVQFADTVQIQC